MLLSWLPKQWKQILPEVGYYQGIFLLRFLRREVETEDWKLDRYIRTQALQEGDP